MAELSLRERYARLGIGDVEYAEIQRLVGREPNETELAIFAAMWSEHISYKSSKRWLKHLPTSSDRVLQGPGEGAGVLQVDDETAVAFKMESHNHPSAVEPFQGAATGVGGIIRDVISMGARPIAILDCLRFGSLQPDDLVGQVLCERVIRGISSYGNCIGVPNVGGDIKFHPRFRGNPLVNAMAVGLLEAHNLQRGVAKGEGNPIILYGGGTGRDGLHGAAFASTDLNPEYYDQDRSSVQIGDPFMEKLILEATVELATLPFVIGIQDLGAGGLICASSEMATKSGQGLRIDLDAVHTRESDMLGWEILLSESQERMLVCVDKDHQEDVLERLAHWEVPARVIGHVIAEPMYHAERHGETVINLPAETITAGAPEPDWPRQPRQRPPAREILVDAVNVETLAEKESSDTMRWVYRQYDHMVGTQTLIEPGQSGAAVIQPHGKAWALAIAADGPDPELDCDPRDMIHRLVAECARNVVSVGGDPMGLTNCLNFADPRLPHIYDEFVTVIESLGEACRAYEIPVTGGNVSLYNQSGDVSIPPTPMVGMVGLVETAGQALTAKAPWAELPVMAIGYPSIAGDAFAERKAVNDFVLKLIRERRLSSCGDVARGGLALALAETVLNTPYGLTARYDAALWGSPHDIGHAFVVTCTADQADAVRQLAEAAGLPAVTLGTTTTTRQLLLNDRVIDLDTLLKRAQQTFPKALSQEQA